MGPVPLVGAIVSNRVSTARLLLENGADPNLKVPCIGLVRLAMHASDAMAQLLIEFGAVVNRRSRGIYSPLHSAMNGGRSVETIKALVNKGARILDTTFTDETALDCARNQTSPAAVNYLAPLIRDAAARAYVLDVAIAFASKRLPPYVVLEIIDWLPIKVGQTVFRLVDVPEIKKVQILVGVQQTQNRLLAERGANKKSKI